MNDGKGTVSVGSGTLPTGACVYCGKICETKNGACAECMGSPTVISGKFPTALAERFITYMEEKSYPTSNALLMEILNSFFGYGRSQRPLPKDKDEAYLRLMDDLSLFPEYSDVVLRVKEDYEMFRLPDAVRNLLPSLKGYPKEFSEILSLEARRPAELKMLTEMPQDVLETLNIFSSYPETVRSSLQVITAYPELAERLLGYLDKGSLTGEVPDAAPRQESAESASHPIFVPCHGSLPSDVLKASASMCTLRDFRPALPPEYLCTSRVHLKICCGIRPRLKTIERLCASGTLRQVILPVTGVSP